MMDVIKHWNNEGWVVGKSGIKMYSLVIMLLGRRYRFVRGVVVGFKGMLACRN